MIKRDIATIAIRILAIYVMLQVLQGLSYIAASLWGSSTSTGSLWPFVNEVIMLLSGIFLWLFAPTIADFMLSDGSSAVSTNFTLEDMETSLVALTGLFMFIYTLPGLLASLFGMSSPHSVVSGYSESSAYFDHEKALRYKLIVSSVIKLVVGSVLICTSSPIVKTMHKLQDFKWVRE